MIQHSLKIHAADSSLDYAKLVSKLTAPNDTYIHSQHGPITYNPQKEVIIFRGSAKAVVEQVKKELQDLLKTHSKRKGMDPSRESVSDLDFEPSGPQARTLRSSDESFNGSFERQKIFPVNPKDHRRLVAVWFKHILPALPKILRSRVGASYAASLVRQGQVDIRADPCIELASPCVPGPEAQKVIKDMVHDVCVKANHDPISVRFSQGNVKKLAGGKVDDDDDAQEAISYNQYRCNLARPCSKLRMGASLGLLSSRTVSATLGGYVLVGGEKYMLTSEHFVTESQKVANTDGDDTDLETLTSPSRYDLLWQAHSLDQRLRDLKSVNDQQLKDTYDDQEIPIDPQYLLSECKENDWFERIENLLYQLRKPSEAYGIGKVIKRSKEAIAANIPESIADVITRTGHCQDQIIYHMDWSLCMLKEQARDSGENRHKYKSESDARAADYMEEQDQRYQPGDVCYRTCVVEAGIEVYYVGRGSGYRSGTVNIPSLVSRDSIETYAWEIIDSRGTKLLNPEVQGDSGAWVVKRNGNTVMGQVHSLSSGRILFTPIDAIFDDVSRNCGVEVGLPPHAPDEEPRTEAQPLCSVVQTPPLRPLNFLKPLCTPKATSTSSKTYLSQFIKTSRKVISQSDIVKAADGLSSGSSCSPISFSPSLVDTWQSVKSDWNQISSPKLLNCLGFSSAQDDVDRSSAQSLPILAIEAKTSEIPHLKLDEQDEPQMAEWTSYGFQARFHVQVRTISTTHTPTWPMMERNEIAPISPSFSFARLRLSQKINMPASLNSLFFQSKRVSRGMGM